MSDGRAKGRIRRNPRIFTVQGWKRANWYPPTDNCITTFPSVGLYWSVSAGASILR